MPRSTKRNVDTSDSVHGKGPIPAYKKRGSSIEPPRKGKA